MLANEPDVSVVMGVYNGSGALESTLESIRSQESLSWELVVVDDGSTDGSGEILRRLAADDPRIRILDQENRGLTSALIRGCRAARGSCIARQDVGDRSLPGRLANQAHYLARHPEAVLISSGARVVGPGGEPLYEVVPETEAFHRQAPVGVFHPSVMFRRSTYEKVGGYRPQFYYAQDLDLFFRLAEKGTCAALSDVLYLSTMTVHSISGLHRREQEKLRRLVVESARLRGQGSSEDAVLGEAERIRPRERSAPRRFQRAAASYFIGACLRRQGHAAAARYFRQAVSDNPLHLKSWLRLLVLSASDPETIPVDRS